MKFFVDTADTADIRDLAATGLLDGVTTNPSLILKSGRPMIEVIEDRLPMPITATLRPWRLNVVNGWMIDPSGEAPGCDGSSRR